MSSGSVLPVPSNPVKNNHSFFVEQASTDSFVEIEFLEPPKTIPFTSRNITILNDGVNPVDFSFDGTNVHGKILITEKLEFPGRAETSIHIKSTGAGNPGTLRIYVW